MTRETVPSDEAIRPYFNPAYWDNHTPGFPEQFAERHPLPFFAFGGIKRFFRNGQHDRPRTLRDAQPGEELKPGVLDAIETDALFIARREVLRYRVPDALAFLHQSPDLGPTPQIPRQILPILLGKEALSSQITGLFGEYRSEVIIGERTIGKGGERFVGISTDEIKRDGKRLVVPWRYSFAAKEIHVGAIDHCAERQPRHNYDIMPSQATISRITALRVIIGQKNRPGRFRCPRPVFNF